MLPKYPKSLLFLKKEIFHNLSSFSELESRIADLPTPNERGDAFEVFAEAYLNTQRIVQAKEVWPGKSIPSEMLRQLRIPYQDMGSDGVFETNLGEVHAYQVKFRTGRPSLTWTELSTFIGLTDRFAQRVLFTNCNDFASVLDECRGFFCIRGNDLDRLERRDFESIQKWLEQGILEHKRKTPLPHQNEALENILSGLKQGNRATAIMACGTGKTLVALWTAERFGARSVLVLLPSLSLVRQTLHEWNRETSWPEYASLCVCSDPTVENDKDDLIVKQSDLDFPVTTDSAIVRKFLSHNFPGVKVVFSTYQSAKVVAEAMNGNDSVDLGIFDEAHKTAGRTATRFGFALNDENLPIQKRLFMTATPRHYDVNKRDKEGDAKVVFSMDVPEIYGPTVHKLYFSEAAQRDIICDYKVVISIVTSEMVSEEVLRRGEVLVEGDLVKATQVANQIALHKAVQEYHVKKVFTFHSAVKAAQSFTGEGGEGIKSHLKDFKTYHVNGKMKTSERECHMNEFKKSGKGVISNARCLTEGVDVPAVDMVAFMSPKKSRVDIVQAVGRAMRKESNKTVGYVLVPLFLKQAEGESIEDALARTRFDDIWLVLEAMKEQDAELADIIRQMRENQGRTGECDGDHFREKVEILGPGIALEFLRGVIIASIVDKLGITWDERFGELKKYKEQFGHCNVPIFWSENLKLGYWVDKQRENEIKNKLTEVRISKLENIGFDWDPTSTRWNEVYTALRVFKEKYGHCNVPLDVTAYKELGNWVRAQRQAKRYRDNRALNEEQIKRLDSIGFDWGRNRLTLTHWEKQYAMLLKFKEKHGHCNVPVFWSENLELGYWVYDQRENKKKSKLTEEQIKRLKSIGFEWTRQ